MQSLLVTAVIIHICVIWENVLCFSLVLCFLIFCHLGVLDYGWLLWMEQQGYPYCHIASFFSWVGFRGIGLGQDWRGWRWAEYACHVWHVSWLLAGSRILATSCLSNMAVVHSLHLSFVDCLFCFQIESRGALYCFWTLIPEARETSWPSKLVLKVTHLVQNCSPVVPGVRASCSGTAWRAGAACPVRGQLLVWALQRTLWYFFLACTSQEEIVCLHACPCWILHLPRLASKHSVEAEAGGF